MKKLLYSAAVIVAMGIASNASAQLIDESNVTITMDLQPILQLNMNGPQNLNFVFDQIPKYVGGITQYGVTQLQVNSTVSWDLYAVGFSSSGALIPTWDQQVVYGGGTDPLAFGSTALGGLPCSLLEIRQDKANPLHALAAGAFADYNSVFQVSPVATGNNNIYASSSPYIPPTDAEKYIAGGGTSADFVVGGSYLVAQGGVFGAGSNYYYSIDYRIVPGLPAIFPNAATNVPVVQDLVTLYGAGAYAQPGVYTMNVKYVLIENQ